MLSGRLIHYLDDYLGVDRGFTQCQDLLQLFKKCMFQLGVPLAEEKTEGPVTVLSFLGLELDSVHMEVRIPQDKIIEVISSIKLVLTKDKVTLKIMQSLIGTLNFFCRAIVPGRPFCRRLINSICGLTKPHHHLRITKDIRLDLLVWLHFFRHHNGVSVFHDRFWLSNEDVEHYTDSAGGLDRGFGIFFQTKWSYGRWPETWHKQGITKDITVLELFPILVALHLWGEELRNKKIKFHCDNIAVVHILNSMTSKSDHVMHIVRLLTIKCLEINIVIKAVHIPGTKNTICDALSRFKLQKFRELAPRPNQAHKRSYAIYGTSSVRSTSAFKCKHFVKHCANLSNGH